MLDTPGMYMELPPLFSSLSAPGPLTGDSTLYLGDTLLGLYLGLYVYWGVVGEYEGE